MPREVWAWTESGGSVGEVVQVKVSGRVFETKGGSEVSDVPEDTDLSLYTTDQIVDALAKRFDALVLTGVTSLDSQREEFYLSWRGGQTVCMGLCTRSGARILQVSLGDEED
jgi:hypothetical protein